MANRCYMVGWDAAKGVPMAPSLELNYDVPLFWLAMFDASDIHDVTVDGEAFVKPPGAAPDYAIQTYLWSPAAKAIERLAQRMPTLGSATNKHVLADKFQQFIGKYAERSFMLQVSELASMMEAGTYATHLREQLERIADPRTPAARVVGNFDESSQHAENLLVGWGTALTVREKDAVKVRKESKRLTSAAAKRNEQWQVAIDACPASGRKPYSSTNTFQAGDVIEHAKFGPGLVLRIVDKKKIEVQFAETMNTLVHQPA